jgi:hypothetical protein
MSEAGPVRVPKEVLGELESVLRYVGTEVLDIPTLRYVAMETDKPALAVWVDRHAPEYGRGLLDGFEGREFVSSRRRAGERRLLRSPVGIR